MIKPSGIFCTTYKQDTKIFFAPVHWYSLLIFLVILFLAPFYLSPSKLSLLAYIGILIIITHGLNLLTGLCGQISVGQAAFVGVGAYTYGILVVKLGMPGIIAIPVSAFSAGIIGVIFGLPAARIKGFYLLMSTMAAQFILVWVFVHARPLTGGIVYGLSVPEFSLFGIILDSDTRKYIFIMLFVILMTFIAKNVQRSRMGRAFVAIRDNDLAAEVMGINIVFYKFMAFFVCSFFAGIGGSLWAIFANHVHPDQFTFMDSIWYIGFLIVGGIGSTMGVIFGTMFIKIMDELVTVYSPLIANLIPGLEAGVFAGLGIVMFGLIILLALVFEPRGINHRWEMFKNSMRLHPYSYH
jgi:branched-chain amino acid transport system permease protein